MPTIIEPLRADWELVQGQVKEARDRGDGGAALKAVKTFHHRLCTTRVLDPACGTGNFLYVSLELMKRLEGEVLEALDDLGEDQARLAMEGETVGPRQFFGLDVSGRAVPIADLVLWIGYLKWQIRTAGVGSIAEPVLHAYGTIREQDAIIAYDRQEILRDASGKPLSRWDGVTRKLHPVTGEEVPDPDATVPLYSYVNPRRAPWPEAEFIVGNPPFIGGKDMRAELGDGYAEACWKARPLVPGGADFVMHFWDEAATRLTAKMPKGKTNPTRRFGFITTNSITQTFSRRVIERHMAAKEPLSLVYAVPDHPWLKAAVRIAMTVAVAGEREGVLAELVSEAGLNTDTPIVGLDGREGKIRADLTIGANIASLSDLTSNGNVSFRGVCVGGDGFFIRSVDDAQRLSARTPSLLHPIRNGRDFAQRITPKWTVDAFGLTEGALSKNYPEIYQHLFDTVRPVRQLSQRASYRDNWWIFMEPRPEFRDAVARLTTYLVTPMTARHRYFVSVAKKDVSDQGLICLSINNTVIQAILSGRIHLIWALATGGFLGVGNDPRYNNSRIFDPFPFPLAVDPTLKPSDPLFAQQERLRELGERLDGFRKERLAEHDFLTMTGLYNALERLRELDAGIGAPLTEAERDVHQAGLISVLKEIHDDIDRAVFAAYGWDDLIPDIVGKPGATLPSPHKSEGQEKAEEELLSRLVALNLERAAEEKRGLVRWLRPDYQIAKLGPKAPKPVGEQATLEIALPEAAAGRPGWPADGLDQIRLVRDMLAGAPAPAPAQAIAGAFDGRSTPKRRDRVGEVLETLVATGLARTSDHDGERRYFLPR